MLFRSELKMGTLSSFKGLAVEVDTGGVERATGRVLAFEEVGAVEAESPVSSMTGERSWTLLSMASFILPSLFFSLDEEDSTSWLEEDMPSSSWSLGELAEGIGSPRSPGSP